MATTGRHSLPVPACKPHPLNSTSDFEDLLPPQEYNDCHSCGYVQVWSESVGCVEGVWRGSVWSGSVGVWRKVWGCEGVRSDVMYHDLTSPLVQTWTPSSCSTLGWYIWLCWSLLWPKLSRSHFLWEGPSPSTR